MTESVVQRIPSSSTQENVGILRFNETSPSPTPTASLNSSENSLQDGLRNVKGYYIDDVDDGLNDLQVIFLACLATLIPLIITVLAAFGIRILWVKYGRRRKGSDGNLDRGTIGSTDKPLHSNLMNIEKVDPHLEINTEEMEICDNTSVNVNTSSQVRSNHSSTNGSIITMTLKNNHLIVETEERNDIEEDSRETTMKYSPGARDGIFIVEVQQGVRRSPTSTTAVNVSDQCAVVHNPADSSNSEETMMASDEPDDLGYTDVPCHQKSSSTLGSQAKTGLTQSNSSLAQPSYGYTNQQCYDNEVYGYNLYNGYLNDEPLKRLHSNQKLRITSALYKNPSKSVDLDAPPADGFLLSDIAAANKMEQNKSDSNVQSNS